MTNFNSIRDVYTHIIEEVLNDKQKCTKFAVLYASNGSGKTRLSKLFEDNHNDTEDNHNNKVLCYNAFTEDLFSWDNTNYHLNFDSTHFIFDIIKQEGLDSAIIDNFKNFIGLESKLEPRFNFKLKQIKFGIYTGDTSPISYIKISRGEESIFIWSVFYTVLDTMNSQLEVDSKLRSTHSFDQIQYVVIDDPVSSMDDTRIITIALELVKLVAASPPNLKFLITTHHALFFNILFNAHEKEYNREYKENYILSKSRTEIHLKKQDKDSPFAYHHLIISDIKEAVNRNDIKKYHFNLFRALLEKTANFLGYEGWKKLLSKEEHNESFLKKLNHYSHGGLSELDFRDLSEDEKKNFKDMFDSFIKDFKWYKKPPHNG